MRGLVRVSAILGALLVGSAAWWVLATAQTQHGRQDEIALQEARNLGKAFYETPGSSLLAVEQLRKALDLNPGSARELLNHGLGLLRAGQREEGMAQVAQAQRIDRDLPHTYFNLGIEYKKAGEVEKAIDQFLQMERLVPDEAKTQYNLGALYKQQGNIRRAIEKFERTIRLDPSLAAPHFQLFGILRRIDPDRAMQELDTFKALKDATDDAAVGEDVDWSFYSELHDPSLATGAAATAGPYEFASSLVAELNAPPAGLLSFDVNGDGDPDALAWSESGAAVLVGGADAGPRTWSESGAAVLVGGADAGPRTSSVGLGGGRNYSPGDFDGDGLADLCRVTAEGVAVLLNRGGRSFESVFSATGRFGLCLFADYDHDNDFDLLALGEDKRLYQNDGDGSVRDVTAEFPFGDGPVRAAGFAELFEDNGQDFIAVYGDSVAVHQDRKLGLYDEAVAVDGAVVPSGSVRMDIVDANHDQYLDVAVTTAEQTLLLPNRFGTLQAGKTLARVDAWADFQLRGRFDAAAEGGFMVNQGSFEFTEVPSPSESSWAARVAGDFDADGKPDLIGVTAAGEVQFAANRVETSNRGITVRLEGVKSPAIGTQARVEVKAGLTYGKQVYAGVPLQFGLGPSAPLDTIRVTWANGLIQNEIPEEPVDAISIKEAPRLSGSCPMVYTWNGNEFVYISEVLGVAPLGASLARGVYFSVDHDEYVTIRGEQLKERDGYLDVRLTEELRETAYIDKMRLIAVDHSRDLEIVTSEKAKGPPFPEFKLYGVRSRLKPVRATNHRGEDVLVRVAASDRAYATFDRNFENLAERHSLELEFPPFDARDAVLFLEGWVDWSSASSIVGASQGRSSAIAPPFLEVQDETGAWRTAVADVGLPGGTVRTIAVDLGGVPLPATGAPRIRITTNMCVYWDAAYVGIDVREPQARLTSLEPARAQLRFHGFSRNFVTEGRTQPETFDYQQVSTTSNWNPTPGLYTRFGDVRDLLYSEDDRFAIMGAGDEIELRFAVRDLPPLPSGWIRDYLLLVDGWAKENEPNTAHGDSVSPLPFHAMSGYPYGPDERYPDTPAHQADLEHYHTRPAMRLVRPLVAGGAPR